MAPLVANMIEGEAKTEGMLTWPKEKQAEFNSRLNACRQGFDIKYVPDTEEWEVTTNPKKECCMAMRMIDPQITCKPKPKAAETNWWIPSQPEQPTSTWDGIEKIMDNYLRSRPWLAWTMTQTYLKPIVNRGFFQKLMSHIFVWTVAGYALITGGALALTSWALGETFAAGAIIKLLVNPKKLFGLIPVIKKIAKLIKKRPPPPPAPPVQPVEFKESGVGERTASGDSRRITIDPKTVSVIAGGLGALGAAYMLRKMAGKAVLGPMSVVPGAGEMFWNMFKGLKNSIGCTFGDDASCRQLDEMEPRIKA